MFVILQEVSPLDTFAARGPVKSLCSVPSSYFAVVIRARSVSSSTSYILSARNPDDLPRAPSARFDPWQPWRRQALAGQAPRASRYAHRHQLVAFPALVEEQVHPADAFRPRVRPAHLAV